MTTGAPRLLVVSQACFRHVNRAVFRELAASGVTVLLVVPRHLRTGGQTLPTETRPDEPYGMNFVSFVGNHQRLQFVCGLKPLVAAFAPTHVYVDADPSSLLVAQAAWAAPGARLCAITAENLPTKIGARTRAALTEGDLCALVKLAVKGILGRIARARLDRVFTLSEDGTAVMRAQGFRATKVPLGYDPALFFVQPAEKRDAARRALGLTAPTIAYFGRLVPEKGVHVLLDALAEMKDRDWQLLMDSFETKDAYARQLRAQIDQLGLAERVVFFEANHEDMPDYMNAADLVVLPSLSTPKWKEQYGRVIQEAQACGRIVIASDSGAIPETMDGQGYLVTEGDASILAERLRTLLERPDLASAEAAQSARIHRSVHRQAQIIHAYLLSAGST